MLFRKLLLASLLVGVVSGGLLGILQQFVTTPIIIATEVYEVAETATTSESGGHDHGGHDHGWAPRDGLERTLYSMLTAIIIACAYALMLQSAMSLTGRANLRSGILWGLAGYSVFFIAPSLGLSPEIPGTQTAALEDRQVWWLATIAMTAAGLGILVFGKKLVKLAGVPLLLLPQFLGAPHPETHGFTNTSADAVMALTKLENEFIVATTITLALFWIVLGLLSGYACVRYLNRHTS